MMVEKEELSEELSPAQCNETMVDSQSNKANSEMEREGGSPGQQSAQREQGATAHDLSQANGQEEGAEVNRDNEGNADNNQGSWPIEEDSASSSLPDEVGGRWRRFIDMGRRHPWSIDLNKILGEIGTEDNEANEADEANELRENDRVNDSIEVGQAACSQVNDVNEDSIEDLEDTLTATWNDCTRRPRWVSSGRWCLSPPRGPIDLA